MKKKSKPFILVFSLLILFADNVAAQCNGKTVYIQLPSGWSTSTMYYIAGGSANGATLTKDGDWYRFTINNTPAQANAIIFSRLNQNHGYQNSSIGLNDYNAEGINSGNFNCATGGTWYIMEDPNRPGKTLFTTGHPQIYNFYFLPPRNTEWMKRAPYLANQRTNSTEIMKADPNKCGWYKKTYYNLTSGVDMFNSDNIIIYQGPTNKFDQIGILGMDEDPDDWENGKPQPFNLKEQFDALLGTGVPGAIFFVADEGTSGWSAVDPNIYQEERCYYKMATIIYDTHKNLMPGGSFWHYDDNNRGGGVRKGIVQNTLDGNRKMRWRQVNNSYWTEGDFNMAFNCTPARNAMICYDMPFGKDNTGLWTFDSKALCNNGDVDLANVTCANQSGMAQGFYPDRLNATGQRGVDDPTSLGPVLGLGNCTYANCPTCANNQDRGEYSEGTLSTAGELYCSDRGRCGSSSTLNGSGCGSEYAEGTFGAPNNQSCVSGNSGQTWSWGPWTSLPNKNLYFCLETHAEFTYEKGQEFFFRGDDDIWVFINNNLVIDLGGAHMAAPGYVNLDSIGIPGTRWPGGSRLIEGNEYSLDIFFCDRRRTMSNVRISTNMYITQENGLFVNGDGVDTPAEVCLNRDDGGTCAALISGGGKQELCGAEVGYMLDYFVVNRKGDVSYPLDASQSYCSATNTANEILCFGGIRINTQNGRVRVAAGAVQGLTGTQIVKAKIKDSYAQTMTPVPDPIEVARFVVRTTLEMVWGTVRNGTLTGTVLYDGCRKANSAVTGMLVPICVAGGGWSDGSKTTYLVDAEASADIPFTFSQAGLFDGSDHAYLQMYFDSLGHRKVPIDSMFTIPSNGLLVLWVTGGYEQLKEEHEYTINVAGRSVADAVTLTSRLPHLRWTDSTGKALIAGQNKGSRDSGGVFVPVWIGERLTRYLEAYDPATSLPCTVCAFDLRATAKASGLGGDLPETDGELISFNNLRRPDGGVANGKATITFSGKVKVEGADYARITIRGPSESEPASIYWDSLQFKEPPVPYPTDAFLFDSNGDGIGDSLRIVYSRGFDRDSLPNMIEVSWDGTAFLFGVLGHSPNAHGEYEPPDKAANLAYWKPKLRESSVGGPIEKRDSTPQKDGKLGIRDTIVISGFEFSEDIRTRGEGSIVSWSTFKEPSASGIPGDSVAFNLGANMDIQDSMPAIIVSAKYQAGDERGCGGSSRTPCSDRVILEFSEPVVAIEGVTEQQSKNPFAYMLRNRGKDIFDTLNLRHLPKYMRWRTGGHDIVPVAGGDSIVTLTFESYRDASSGDTTNTPIAGDSVKFAVLSVPVLMDLAGNRANPREIGRQIEGRNRFAVDKIAIGSLDPSRNETALRDSIASVFDEYKIKKDAASLFLKHPIEALPYPDGWTARDIGVRYPGTVGLAFKPDIANTLDSLEISYPGISIPDSAVTFHIRSFYHTNLGDYVASRELPAIRCNDDIFPVDEKTGRPSCRASKSGVYVAWNLKDAKGRWAGAGAYVGMHDFRWEVNFKDNGKDIRENNDRIERQIDMFGVRRIKAK